MWVSIGVAAKEAGVHVDTIRNWEKKGYIKSERTPSNRKRFDLNAVISYANANKPKPQEKVTAIYARVSTPSRKSDLDFQKQVLELHCAAKGWQYIIIEDIGSGLNFKKQGLLKLINLIENNKIERILLNYKDRLLRYGNEIIYEICKYHNIEIVVLSESESKTYEEELVDDVLSVITEFSAKLYGSRSHKNKKIVDESKKLFKSEE